MKINIKCEFKKRKELKAKKTIFDYTYDICK